MLKSVMAIDFTNTSSTLFRMVDHCAATDVVAKSNDHLIDLTFSSLVHSLGKSTKLVQGFLYLEGIIILRKNA